MVFSNWFCLDCRIFFGSWFLERFLGILVNNVVGSWFCVRGNEIVFFGSRIVGNYVLFGLVM